MAASGIRMGGVFVEIGADAAKFFSTFTKVNSQIGKIASSVQSAGTKMAAFGGAVVAPILASATAFASVGSAINDMSKRTGVSAEALSVLAFAADQTGVGMGDVEVAVKKMQKTLFAASNGGKEAADALARLGLSASDLEGLSADQQMAKIADGLMAIQDPGMRAALAMQIFGKSGTAVLPMLEGGSAGIADFAAQAARLGLIMDSETAAKADALGDAIDALAAAMKMAFIQIGSAVAPILTQVANGLAIVAKNVGTFIANNQQFVIAALKIGAALTAAGAALKGIGILIGVLASPLVLAASAFAVAGVAAYKFRDQIAAAFSGVSGYISQAADAISQTFGPAITSAQVVFGDLANTASATFNGIYEAIAAGDLAKAMDILWAGLQAGWLRGVEALMGYVDPFVSELQNTWTVLGAEIYKAWDATWVAVGNSFNTVGAYLSGVMDNVINGLLSSWDALEAGIRKAWVRVQGIFRDGQDTRGQLDAIDAEMSARAASRSGGGIEGRLAAAAQQNETASQSLAQRNAAVDAATGQAILGRDASIADRSMARREATMTAEQKLAALTAGISGGSLSDIATAVAAATAASGAIPSPPDTTSRGSVAGTFSSLNLGASLGGSSAAERTAKATEEIAKNTRNLQGDTVAA